MPRRIRPLCDAERLGPGLLVARRSFFGTVAAACAAATLPGSRATWRDRQALGDWTIAQFVAEVAPVCKELLTDTSARGQDRYLLTLASFAVRLGAVPTPDTRQAGDGHRIGSHHGPDPFTVLHWLLESGARIQPHAHTYGNVVTLGLAGAARVDNFEVVGERDYASTEPVVVQRTHQQLLRPGDVNLVSLERSYVHGFVAGPQGAAGLDITTRIAAKQPTPVLTLGEPLDREAMTFAARWTTGG